MSPVVPNARGAAAVDEPDAAGGPEHGDVGVAVTVVVARHRDVAAGAELRPRPPLHEPDAARGPEHGDVGRAVAVVVARAPGCRPLARTATVAPPWTNQTPVEGRNTAKSVVAVAVVVARHRDVARGPELRRAAAR